MTILNTENGIGKFGIYKEILIEPKLAIETTLGLPQYLPTSEPASPQVSFTITEDMIPVFSVEPYSYINVPIIYIAGKNISTTNAYPLGYRISKNGVSIYTFSAASNITANNNWTLQIYRLVDVQVGDLIEVTLWTNASSVLNYDYHCLIMYPSRLFVEKPSILLTELYIHAAAAVAWKPTAGTIGTNAASYIYFDPMGAKYDTIGYAQSAFTLPIFKQHPSYGVFRMPWGDHTTSQGVRLHATVKPSYTLLATPSTISYRPLYL